MSTNGKDPVGKIRIDGKVYEIPTDYRIREYKLLTEKAGVKAISEVDFTDPNVIAAVAYILLSREDPDYDESQLEDVMVGFVDEGDVIPPAKRPRRTGARS